MVIKNLVESLVFDALDTIIADFDADERARLDAACYVLNRIPPRYAGSSRGIARLTREIQRDDQIRIDILRLAHEALKRVTTTRREGGDESDSLQNASGPVYNYPVIRGRLLNGSTFAPLADLEVELFCDGESVPMIDGRWQNPYPVSSHTPGTFLFCPRPQPATSPDEETTVSFELRATHGDYDPFRHLFRVSLVAESNPNHSYSLEQEFVLPDLYLFPR